MVLGLGGQTGYGVEAVLVKPSGVCGSTPYLSLVGRSWVTPGSQPTSQKTSPEEKGPQCPQRPVLDLAERWRCQLPGDSSGPQSQGEG